MLRIGYACLTAGSYDIKYRTLTRKYLTKENLYAVIASNLRVLSMQLDYNHKNNIKVFRISSDFIPFGSSLDNTFPWESDFEHEFNEIRQKIKAYEIRISMHPGQYSVLNSPRLEVLEATVRDLDYHARLMAKFGATQQNKMILHIGGIYGDKNASISRFIENYKLLSPNITKHLVIENDDHFYTLQDVLGISYLTGAPVIFDYFHHKVLPSLLNLTTKEIIELVRSTWQKADGNLKIHYSQAHPTKRGGAHSLSIKYSEFMGDLFEIEDDEIDVMLEVKDKNISAIKIQNIVSNVDTAVLEKEWARYKYLVLEHSQNIYLKIRELLKRKSDKIGPEFYSLIEESLNIEANQGSVLNAAQHVWGHLNNKVNEIEKRRVYKIFNMLDSDISKIKNLKNALLKLALKYDEQYLTNSLYFYFNGFAEIK